MPELLSKTEQGVKRSRESWFGKVASLFNRPKIETETWDELEELLTAADVGVATTGKLIQSVKQRVKEEKLSESAQVRSALKKEMIRMLSFDNDTKPAAAEALWIVLVVGVNSSGYHGGGESSSSGVYQFPTGPQHRQAIR